MEVESTRDQNQDIQTDFNWKFPHLHKLIYVSMEFLKIYSDGILIVTSTKNFVHVSETIKNTMHIVLIIRDMCNGNSLIVCTNSLYS